MKIIGRIDIADFPKLDLQNINIKVDTGAYTSSIHCHDVQEIELDGKKHIEFKLLDPSHPQYNHKVFKVTNYEVKSVKSSFGDVEKRFVIHTKIVVFGKEYSIKLSLSERSDMRIPILIGRRFLNKKFIVDTSLNNLSFKLKSKKKNA
ncbi:peptidase [Ancylomarina euxinus]|uniref:Peptidase n=1 Tax=Ancylomarina euxinus TaxID=2283627 RepID=A0A425Y1T9_9BACT|nr:RimK/LysX family protein [Ancylomarina euxinus]MCZ4695036.1 RimK/LysX family protein [Ancylomarina euxinus]MUP15028.1 peptidase [Ancylomarina euxinus]RRG21915.1 peptidase [Ancylomarina euxinus]